jgi:hypothetical protein
MKIDRFGVTRSTALKDSRRFTSNGKQRATYDNLEVDKTSGIALEFGAVDCDI